MTTRRANVGPDRLIWPDGSPIALDQKVTCTTRQPRYAGRVGMVSSLSPCRPETGQPCRDPARHDEIGVDGVGESLAWFRADELEPAKTGVERPRTRANPDDEQTDEVA